MWLNYLLWAKPSISAMLNDNGGVMDDLIVYRANEAETAYRIVSNAATRAERFNSLPKVGEALALKSPALRFGHAGRARPQSH